jgi:hypothetical protein
MKKYVQPVIGLVIFMFFSAVNAQSQISHVIKGLVVDSAKSPLQGSNIKLLADNGDSAEAMTGPSGRFVVGGVRGTKITVTVSSVGFQSIRMHYLFGGDTVVILPAFILQPLFNNLIPVTVASVNPMTIKEDTVTYNVAAYKVRDNAMVEDVLRKLPGVDVDADGNVTAQGKQVSKVRVNGKDFFGGDVKTATKNLPADVVENIQMIDDYGDQANLTGVKTGEPDKIMNITIRPDKNHGISSQFTVGDGGDALPKNPGVTNDNRYAALLNAFRFNGNQQIAVLGNVNNTNLNTFSFGSPTAAPSGGGVALNAKIALDGAMVSGLKISLGGGGNFTGQSNSQNGITDTHSAGFNYRDQWGKALSVYGSYSFANNTTAANTNTFQQNTSPTNPGTTTQTNNESDNNINHRFNWNMEYKPDTLTYFKVIPSFSYGGTTTNALGNVNSAKDGLTDAAYTSSLYGTSASTNYSLTALYNHRFKRQGRNFSINVNAGSGNSQQYQNPLVNYTVGTGALASQQINTNSHSTNYGVTLSYLEPIAKFTYLEFNYALNYSLTTSNKQTGVLDSASKIYLPDSALSNQYNYTFITNRFGLNYRHVKKTYNYTIGLGLEPAVLNSYSPLTELHTHQDVLNVVPIAHLVFDLSRNRVLSLNYNGNTGQPTFAQLQPVTDFSNALYPVEGNPRLKPQFTNNLSVHFNQFDFASGNSFFTNASFSQTQNQIVTNTITYPAKYPLNPVLQNTYLTQYTTANGYYTASGFASYSIPWAKRKYTLMLNANIAYTNNIGFLTNVDSSNFKQTTVENTARNLTFTPGARFRLDIPDVIDAQVLSNYSINKTDNSIKNSFTNTSVNIRTWTMGVSGKSYIKKEWTFSYEYTKAINYGYTLPVPNPNILNLYVERRFLKGNKATIRLAAFDVFNQNTGYSTTTTASTITQTVTNRLGRYYLATFTLRLQKFARR